MQGQVVCHGCTNFLVYTRGASHICCSICGVVTPMPPPGLELSQLICGHCRAMLYHPRGAASVRCSCCRTFNLVPATINSVAHVNCGNCYNLLTYPAGASSVKCLLCQFVTNINTGDPRVRIPANRSGSTSAPAPAPARAYSLSETVVVLNPMTIDENGNLVNNVVVGVIT